VRAPKKKKLPPKTQKPWADFVDAKSLVATILGGLLVLVVSLVSTYVMEESRAKAEEIRQASLDIQTADNLSQEEAGWVDAIRYYKDALSKLSRKEDPSYYSDAETGLALCYLKQAQKNKGEEAARQAVEALKDVMEIFKSVYGKNPSGADKEKISRVLNALGDSLSVLSEIKEKVPYLEECIELHREALNSLGQDDPGLSATIFMNLGEEYMELAKEKDPLSNSQQALDADQAALKYFTALDHPKEYVKVSNNIGRAFLNLSETSDMAENIRKAMAAYHEALKTASLESDPEGYALTQMNVGICLLDLYNLQKYPAELAEALQASQNALLVFKPDTDPYHYASIQANIGETYTVLYEAAKKKVFLDKALTATGEALKIFKADVYPHNYAMLKLNLGEIYDLFAPISDKTANFQRAIESYSDGLTVCTLDKYPLEYAKLMNNIALVYAEIALLGNKEQNILMALKACQETLKVWTPDKYPLDFARAQLNLGNSLLVYSEIPGRENYRSTALQSFAQAAEIYKKQNLSQQYQIVLRMINRVKKTGPVGNSIPAPSLPASNSAPGTKL
jgi:tetratricopeptide (TPR) repeat protein